MKELFVLLATCLFAFGIPLAIISKNSRKNFVDKYGNPITDKDTLDEKISDAHKGAPY